MRLYLFPITRQRTLIYCKRTKPSTLLPAPSTSSTSSPTDSPSSPPSSSSSSQPPKPPILDRITTRANATWVSWESAPSGWKLKVTTWGNQLFAKIPYTEWGLKSIPPLSSARARDETTLSQIPRSDPDASARARRRTAEVDVVYPARLFRDESEIKGILAKMAGENKGIYRRRMWWSILIMPFTAPVALIPVIPNLPFFYLVFRAWSFWRAGAGCGHIEHLLQRDLINGRPSEVLQRLWDAGPVAKETVERLKERVGKLKTEGGKEGAEKVEPEDAEVEAVAMEVLGESKTEAKATPEPTIPEGEEKLLYSEGHGKVVALTLNLPEVEVELERAHAQVSKDLAKAEQKDQSDPQATKEKR